MSQEHSGGCSIEGVDVAEVEGGSRRIPDEEMATFKRLPESNHEAPQGGVATHKQTTHERCAATYGQATHERGIATHESTIHEGGVATHG